MKSLLPWFCLVAAANNGVAFANDGLDAYRQGNYIEAAKQLTSTAAGNDPIVDYYMGRMRLYGYGQLKNNALAVRYLRQAAEKGLLPAQHIMARFALLDENNPEQALVWFKKAADANDTEAQMYCAAAYLFGVGTKKNPDIAKRYYIAAARNGDSIAQYTLAASFLETHQSANKKLGLLWLNKSVEQKNPEAQVMLGELYTSGTLLDHDLVKAKEWVGLAVAQGYVPAMYQMGEIARNENNFSLAKTWYTKAADAHYSPAEIALSKLYFVEKGPMYDPHAGFLWMLKAAQNGSADAQLALASMYKNGQGTEVDENLAKEWQQKAAETNKGTSLLASIKAVNWLSNGRASTFADTVYRMRGINAWLNRGVLKENNYNQPPQMEPVTREIIYKPQFVMINPNKIAISEYYDALVTSLGNLPQEALVFPQYSLGNRLEKQQQSNKTTVKPVSSNEDGFDYLQHLSASDSPDQPNYQEAFKQLENQAILGDSTAQFDLAEMYQHGVGAKKDIQEAIKYYRQAAAQQDLRAEYNLGVLYLDGLDIVADYKLGLDWLNDAAFKGNDYAQYVLARIGEQGYRDKTGTVVIQPNHELAMSMYNLAAANNYGPAQYRLAEILVREKPVDVSIAAKQQRDQMVKDLYQGAVSYGVEQAALPLAFYNAMDHDVKKQQQAFALAKKSAQEGNIDAALLLGLMYDRGIAVAANHADALESYRQAELNPISAFILGTYLNDGIGVSKDLDKSRVYLQKAADAGFSYANLNLAIMKQQQGEVFLPELDKALALGNSPAGLLLADYYLSLASNDQQMQQAHDIYQQFAEKGDKEAQLKLAFLFEQGLGGKVDVVTAQKWYTLAAEQGQPVAQYLLGRLYQLGWLDKQPDYVEAKKWYTAAGSNYAPAATALGFIYDTVDDNYQKAAEGYQMAAQQASPIGQFDLGLIYEKGKGCPVDFAKATALYLQAANQGHHQAMVQLAGLYFNGAMGSRDEQQALHWYKKAADQGDRDALYQLGLLSETGVATKLDYPDAVQYYQQAADKGNAKAKLALARMYQYGLGVPKNIEQAAKFYKELSLLDNAYAQYQLAMFYYEDTSGAHSSQQGKQLLQQAAVNGSQEARRALQWMDAQAQERVSFIEPGSLPSSPALTTLPAELMYLNALNAWNRGDESSSRVILARILTKYPNYVPAKRAYEQLSRQQMTKSETDHNKV